MSDFNYIDLFAGAGGLSEGFIKSGFKPIAHVESDKSACYTLKTRTVFHYLKNRKQKSIYYSYLKGEISRDKLYSSVPAESLRAVINAKIGVDNRFIFKEIDSLLKGKKVDLIIGGPPCQAYSYIGRAALKHRKKDERTTLYIQYGRFLKKYKPKLFVFENVPGLLTAGEGQYFKNLQKYYKRLGYTVEAKLLNAINYGVVQHRERVFIMGWRKRIKLTYPKIYEIKNQFFRDDIFNDLPAIKPGETQRYHAYNGKTINDYLIKAEIRNGVDFVSQHLTRPHNKRDLRIYKLAIRKLKEGIRLKNNQIPEMMRTQLNVVDFLDRFKVVDVIPHAMIAHISKDGHHFIHHDEEQLRSISVREAARIQSFPDNYFFEGVKEDQPRTAAFRQIGNAVPPMLANKIAKALHNRFLKL
ncbi:MAG TPA: DNA cytosine methyltransferase [Saprospiraceae bacterium]|nr:DNA cytosine methyltransferase [Saprospiraceae bacterium]